MDYLQVELDSAVPMVFEQVFPDGAFVTGEPVMVKDYEASSRDKAVQATVEVVDQNGEPRPVRVWQAKLQDGAGEQFVLRIVADHQPVFPAAVLGGLRPVELEGLMLQVRLDKGRCKPPWDGNAHRCGARLERKYWATGVKDPGKAGKTSAPAESAKAA